MSYELHLFRARAGVDLLRAAEESLAASESSVDPGPPDPMVEQRLQALAAALQSRYPDFEIFPLRTESPAPVGEAPRRSMTAAFVSPPDDRILVSLTGATASVSVWYGVGDADAVWEEAWGAIEVLRREGRFHVYDPQLGRVVDHDLDRPAVLEKYLEAASYAGAAGARDVAEPRPRWERLLWRMGQALRFRPGPARREVEPRLRNRREVEAQLVEVARRHAAGHPAVAGRTETIVLQMVVTSSGGSDRVEVDVASPGCDPALVEEVIGIGARMRFRPARLDASPVPVLVTIPLTITFPG